jgi:hypothetical protein
VYRSTPWGPCHAPNVVNSGSFIKPSALLGWGGIEHPSPYATAGRKRRREGAPRDNITSVRQLLKTAYLMHPTRGRTGGEVFRIDLGLVAAGAQQEKEVGSLEEGSV